MPNMNESIDFGVNACLHNLGVLLSAHTYYCPCFERKDLVFPTEPARQLQYMQTISNNNCACVACRPTCSEGCASGVDD